MLLRILGISKRAGLSSSILLERHVVLGAFLLIYFSNIWYIWGKRLFFHSFIIASLKDRVHLKLRQDWGRGSKSIWLLVVNSSVLHRFSWRKLVLLLPFEFWRILLLLLVKTVWSLIHSVYQKLFLVFMDGRKLVWNSVVNCIYLL